MPYRNVLSGKIADLISLLKKQPRTVRELRELTGMHDVTLRCYLKAFVAEGFLLEGERTGRNRAVVYSWVP
jgi:DNA-binding IclR family transcriptional regulator